MTDTPRAPLPDSTLPLVIEGYEMIRRRRRFLKADVFQGRLLLEPTIFMGGAAAAELFYDESRFSRADAAPALVLKTLFGEGGVQGLDDEAHRARKGMFMSLMTRAALERFVPMLTDAWEERLERWHDEDSVVLLHEAHVALCAAACEFAGLQLRNERIEELAGHCFDMIDGFGTGGPPAWLKARRARLAEEEWARQVVRDVREGRRSPEPGTAAHVFSLPHGQTPALPVEIAAVELLNVIRPIVAIARFVAYAAVALHEHPRLMYRLRQDDTLLVPFVQEVRRFYPFTPLLGARARRDFTWGGARFEEGTLTILDVYGTNRDPASWSQPDLFAPERFVDREPGKFELIPQGGGDFGTGHRCAGEWLTIEALKESVRFLTRRIRYSVPAQELGWSTRRIPARPRDGVVIREIREATPAVQVTPPRRSTV